ncbi:Bacteriophage head-tail adaptor [Sphingobium herbicidovorans NBRC 16415]|uniref:Bacteriophage head-tail adaptor n=1 Tax=Sphingobium herbicidovorans (strain ATCC 700291 / DSM 11019 / CCUG 56400 / KCTC 2939 / LMG 18315 / NBRC 16415 / MH) TaxID=1219045 RepID=A0A086PBG8_SPHHM|nr:head-tail adaptor protein [Sphingobium herbicidovorans]KFG90736.1 Bacteriophage head-tail adaptor [Sphingobium herbicidovorans NBRC 16415]
MSLDAGRRNKRIIIERATETRNSLNEPEKAWVEHTRLWASVYFGSGDEQRQAAQAGGAQAATFEVLANSKSRSLLLTDRVAFDGGIWDIRAIAPMGLNEGVKINAVRAVS